MQEKHCGSTKELHGPQYQLNAGARRTGRTYELDPSPWFPRRCSRSACCLNFISGALAHGPGEGSDASRRNTFLLALVAAPSPGTT